MILFPETLEGKKRLSFWRDTIHFFFYKSIISTNNGRITSEQIDQQ